MRSTRDAARRADAHAVGPPAPVMRSSLEIRLRDGIPIDRAPRLLRNGPVRLADLEDGLGHDVHAMLGLYSQVHSLADERLITFAAGRGANCLAELVPMAPGFRLAPVPQQRIALSRFAHVRPDSAALVLETPLGVGSMRIRHPAALAALGDLAAGVDVKRLCDRAGSPPEMYAFVELLVSGAAAGPAADDSDVPQNESAALQQWEFHDLLFHMRSRLGRHDRQMGATFRFLDRIDPAPALPERTFGTATALPRPAGPPQLDAGLASLLSRRASIRDHGQVSVTIRELGEFLYHSCRVVEIVPGPQGQFTSRPYPNGGASYELEIYLVVDRCLGLAPGVYYYDAAEHGLAQVGPANDDTEALLDQAYISSGQTCRPQVLLAVASRFQRVAWKYAGISYATTLKNVGALYATMYLVATAMGLAACALGVGDSERFSRLAGTDRYTESTVGEFMLGSRA